MLLSNDFIKLWYHNAEVETTYYSLAKTLFRYSEVLFWYFFFYEIIRTESSYIQHAVNITKLLATSREDKSETIIAIHWV